MGYKAKKYRQEIDELAEEFSDELPTFNDRELDEFGEWLEQFKEEKQVFYPTPATIHPINMERAMDDFGATRRRAILVTVLSTDKYGRDTFKVPTMYDLFWNKFDQWDKRNNRKAWGEKKRLEGYAQLADMVGVQADAELYTEEI